MLYSICALIIILGILVLVKQSSSGKIIEGATGNNQYKNYSDDNPLILAEKNAANIQFLKQQIDDIYNYKSQILDLKNVVEQNTYNINQISDVAAQQAHQLTGTKPSDDKQYSNVPPPQSSVSN